MRQFTLVLPKVKAFDFAAYAFSKDIRVMLSWLEAGDLFFATDKVTAICVAAEDIISALSQSDWKQYLKTN